MAVSLVIYSGLALALVGVVAALARWRARATRTRGLWLAAAGVLMVAIGLVLPPSESRASGPGMRLDSFAPVWQFHEVHSIRIAAPPEQVYAAIRRVRADEIFLFRALTWIRRGGRPLPPGVLRAGGREPIIDVALRGGFVLLADDPPRELVVGTVIIHPPGTRGTLTPETFTSPLPPGFALATMNFVVSPREDGGSTVRTETRVFASSPSARRRFAAYWRVIYPGSALIRRSWLNAIDRRAVGGA